MKHNILYSGLFCGLKNVEDNSKDSMLEPDFPRFGHPEYCI